MIVTHKAELDLVNRGPAQRFNAVQGDVNTRVLELSLYTNGAAWALPGGVTVAMRYQKSDGTKGYYDTLPDGTQAWNTDGNTVTITVAPQMLTVAGTVLAQLEITQGVNILAAFTMQLNVEANPAAGVTGSEDYVNWLSWMKQELNEALQEAKESGDFKGDPGEPGPQGPQGETGPQGAAGADGKSAYEYAKDGGYAGTEEDFAKKLVAEYLPAAGGDMTGPINMNGQALTGLNPPTEETGAANKGYVDVAVKMARPRNFLRNSHFINPMNQGGQTTYVYTEGIRSIDGWFLGGYATLKLTDAGIELKSESTENNADIVQVLPNHTRLTGKRMTFAVNTVEYGISLLHFTFGEDQWGFFDGGHLQLIHFNSDRLYIRRENSDAVLTIRWADLYEGEYTLDTLPEHQPKGYENELLICRQYDPVTGEYIGLRRFGQPVNLLDNSDWEIFSNIVNQRGVTNMTPGTVPSYSIDRWYSARTNIAATADGLSLAWDGQNGTDGWIQQKIPNGNRYYGKKITIAITMADGSKKIATGTVPQTTNQSAIFSDWDSDGVRIYCTNMRNSDVFSVVIGVNKTTAVIIKNVAAYEGEYTLDTIPEYQPKGYGAELAECQRYYREFTWLGGGNNFAPIRVMLPLAGPMRMANPTVTFAKTGGTGEVSVSMNGNDAVDITVVGDYATIRVYVSADL